MGTRAFVPEHLLILMTLATTVVHIAASIGALEGPARWNGQWNTPPRAVPSSKTVDGPLLGDGETGLVLGVDAVQGTLTGYISTNSFWLLNSDECTSAGHCEGSHRAGIGGVTLAVRNSTTGELIIPRYSLEQSLENGSVGWALWGGDNAPPPPPRALQGCELEGVWTTSTIGTVHIDGGPPGRFLYKNQDTACKPPPGVCHDGWRNATGIVDNATGVIEMDYHRITTSGCGAHNNWIQCVNLTREGCTCRVTGSFTQDCNHVTMPDSGQWTRKGATPLSPSPPVPTPLPSGQPLLKGSTLISQGDGPTTLITTLSAGAESVDVSWLTWTFGGGNAVSTGRQRGIAYATRTLPGSARPVTGVIASRVQGIVGRQTSVDTECGSKMAGRWLVEGQRHPVVLENRPGSAPNTFFWNNSGGDWKDEGWKIAQGVVLPNDTIVLSYKRIVPTGCEGTACGPPTPHGCVCSFYGTFQGDSCDVFTINHVRWTRASAPSPKQALNVSLCAHQAATVITTVLTSITTNDSAPLTTALDENSNINTNMIRAEAEEFWLHFWSMSSVSLPTQPIVERFWYSAQYLMGMASRAGRIAPGLWGPWVSTDTPAWCGGYTLDYNFEMGFQHLFSSNRGLIADSYYPIILEYARRRGGVEAADNANGACNASGGLKGLPGAVHFTIQLAPGGLANSGDLGIHSNALFAGLHFISKFETSQNTTFLTEESYPLLRAVAAWWVGASDGCPGWLQRQNLAGGTYRYVDNNTCTREGCDNGPHAPKPNPKDLNPAISIAFLMRTLRHLIDVAERGMVIPPSAELARWRDVLKNLAKIPVGKAQSPPNTSVLLPQEYPIFTFPDERHDNPLEFYGIYPGEQIGQSSTPELLEAARNTVLLADVTDPLQENAFQEIFPSFVRVGCAEGCKLNASYILDAFSRVVTENMGENGYLRQGGGGIETAGGALAINDMLLQSHEGFIRLFPVWPRWEDAAFTTLRATGAFLVSASLKNGTVTDVTIKSEAGTNCSLLSPWVNVAASAPVVTHAGKSVAVARIAGPGQLSLWRFATQVGGFYKLAPHVADVLEHTL